MRPKVVSVAVVFATTLLSSCYLAHEPPVDSAVPGREVGAAPAICAVAMRPGAYGRQALVGGPSWYLDTQNWYSYGGECAGQVAWASRAGRLFLAMADVDQRDFPFEHHGWLAARVSVVESDGGCWSTIASISTDRAPSSEPGFYGSHPIAVRSDGAVALLNLQMGSMNNLNEIRESMSGDWQIRVLANPPYPAFGDGGTAAFLGDLLVIQAYWGTPIAVIGSQSALFPSIEVSGEYVLRGPLLFAQADYVRNRTARTASLAGASGSRLLARVVDLDIGGGRTAEGEPRDVLVETYRLDDPTTLVPLSRIALPLALNDHPHGATVTPPALALSDDGGLLAVGASVSTEHEDAPPITLVDLAHGNTTIPIHGSLVGHELPWCPTPQTVAVAAEGNLVAWVSADPAGTGTVANVAERVGDAFELRWTGRPTVTDSAPCQGQVDVESLAIAPDGALAVVGRTACSAGEWGDALGAVRVFILQ